MKIQKGIVKYKDRSDIVCTYGLTDDGQQYYFLDETDTKKFSNGNRIATTALVEAIDPMVKAENVGVIDDNGAIVIPFENRSIRPVNDNVIVVEKANPTSQNVLDALQLRNDPNSAAKLVSTPATIKDKINAQMGVEGKYLFNDQFSEATVCDINGTNLVGGESYSFISTANDKLYLSKNTPESPVVEFSLTTYEVLAAPTNQIDVSTAVVDQQVVEDALNAQAVQTAPVAAQPVEGAVQAVAPEAAPAAPVAAQPVEGAVQAVAPEAAPAAPVATQPVEGAVQAVAPEAAPVAPVAATQAVGAPVEGVAATADGTVVAPVATETPAAVQPENGPVNDTPFSPTDIATGVETAPAAPEAAPADGVQKVVIPSSITANIAVPTAEAAAPAEAVSPEAVQKVVIPSSITANISVPAAPEAAPTEGTVNVEDEVVMAYDDSLSTVTDDKDEFSTDNADINDDLKAFAGGIPSAEETPIDPSADAAPVANEENENSTEITQSLSVVSDNSQEEKVSIDDEDEVPPIVEEEKEETTPEVEEPEAKEEAKEEKTEEKVEDKAPEKEEETKEEAEDKADDKAENKAEDKEEDIKVDDKEDGDAPINIFEEEDAAPFEELDDEPETIKTSATPVAIDAETVLATVDKNKNGIIDSDELMVPKDKEDIDLIKGSKTDGLTPLEKEFSSSLFDKTDDSEDFDRPIPSYGSSSYKTSSKFADDYGSILTDVKPDRITYEPFPGGNKDNIMADVARSMSELMRQNKEQRGVITQIQDKLESSESQRRILAEKYKDQSMRYEALTGKLRALDEVSGRLESKNQLLESRLRDQEKIIAAQERELKILRPQIEGKQDLVKLLADARTLLGSESSYGGYSDEDHYYGRVA